MESAQHILEKIKALLEDARGRILAKDWDAAQSAIESALKLDENNAPSYEAMADLYEAKEGGEQSAAWRNRAQMVRKQAWQRQVEAEARSHHDMLGEPGRHEIP